VSEEKYEKLIEKVRNRLIIAHDFFGKKHKRWLKNFKFRPGVFGVLKQGTLKQGTKVLVQRHPKLKSFGLPGGGVRINESIPHALEREYFEETGIEVETGKLLEITEDFFTYYGEDVHGINIFYEVKKIGGKILPNGNGWDTGEVRFIEIKKFTKKNFSRSQWPFIKSFKLLCEGSGSESCILT
jgi:ADP-ribose pyrophosphatase YjhB (NUDIX family)